MSGAITSRRRPARRPGHDAPRRGYPPRRGRTPRRTPPADAAKSDTNLVAAYAFGLDAGSNGEASNESHAAGGPVGMGIREGETPALRAGRTQAMAHKRRASAASPPSSASASRASRMAGRLLISDATPDSRRYVAMGDAVTVPVIRWLGDRLACAVH